MAGGNFDQYEGVNWNPARKKSSYFGKSTDKLFRNNIMVISCKSDLRSATLHCFSTKRIFNATLLREWSLENLQEKWKIVS